jgi:anaerobic selenocysteine-containing dehydrogenase
VQGGLRVMRIETAKQFGIAANEKVVIRSPVGQLIVQAIVDPRVGRGMVIMPVGTWIKRGGGANVLTEDIISNSGRWRHTGKPALRSSERTTRREPRCEGDLAAVLACRAG